MAQRPLTGASPLVAMLMQVSISASMLTLQPLPLAEAASLTFFLVLAAALWLVAAAVAVGNRRQLSTEPLTPRPLSRENGRGRYLVR
jgi:hypothetical protein